MRLFSFISLVAITALLGLSSCGERPEKKPVGPTTDNSKIPWNRPVAGQGQGQFGMMPGSQYRR